VRLPSEDSLTAIFESLPTTEDSSTPWDLQEVSYNTTRGQDRVTFSMYAPSGRVELAWYQADVERISVRLRDLDSIEVHQMKNNEFLSATGQWGELPVLLKLRLRPEVSVELSYLEPAS
jgi:hypothetical protein